MSFAELIYKLNEFYFTDIWHFCGLLLLILAVRGDISRGLDRVKTFFDKVREKYKRKRIHDDLANNIKAHVPRDVKKFAMIDKNGKED